MLCKKKFASIKYIYKYFFEVICGFKELPLHNIYYTNIKLRIISEFGLDKYKNEVVPVSSSAHVDRASDSYPKGS